MKLFRHVIVAGLLVCMGMGIANAQTVQLECSPPNITQIIHQRPVANITIPGTDRIKGYMEHLPADYASSTDDYPLVIALAGLNEIGQGTLADLCKLFFEWQYLPQIRIEKGWWPATMNATNGNGSSRFITLTPQLTTWDGSSQTLDAFIEYVSGIYRVNRSHIYLIGSSMGAIAAQDYVGTSVEYAKKIAGVLSMSPCVTLNNTQADNIIEGQTSMWFSQCNEDNQCAGTTAKNNHDLLNSKGYGGEKNVLTYYISANGECNDNPHDTWVYVLNTTFSQNVAGTSMNVFSWMMNQTGGVILPVQLASFDVRAVNGQAHLTWQTASEQDGAMFYIERAGDGLKFERVDSVYTRNIPTGSKYQWIDAQPLIGNNFYRLAQRDIDGSIQYFETKKISINARQLITITPNPFQNQLKYTIQSTVANQYTLKVTDLQGRTVYQEKIALNAGTHERQVNTQTWIPGMYLFTVQYQDGSETHKLIKQK